jgi:glycosyltransferase involved in cell wall biosynthesis
VGLDVVAIPSRYEGSPLTLFEAMAVGKPIIASDIPGVREVRRGYSLDPVVERIVDVLRGTSR